MVNTRAYNAKELNATLKSFMVKACEDRIMIFMEFTHKAKFSLDTIKIG